MNTRAPLPMPVVYIAGPYRAASPAGIDLNIQAARHMGLQAVRRGWSPLIPHANTGGLDEADPTIPDDYWLAASMALMKRCDAVLVCPGWRESAGTLAEIEEAKLLSIQIYFDPRDLPTVRFMYGASASLTLRA